MECNLEYEGNIHPNFDQMLFSDFVFKHEWLVEKKKKEAQEGSKKPGMLSLNEMVQRMQSGVDGD